jgi:hypothetical protein
MLSTDYSANVNFSTINNYLVKIIPQKNTDKSWYEINGLENSLLYTKDHLERNVVTSIYFCGLLGHKSPK